MENNRISSNVKTQLFYEYAMKKRKSGVWTFKNQYEQYESQAKSLSTPISGNFYIISFQTEYKPKFSQGGNRKNSESIIS